MSAPFSTAVEPPNYLTALAVFIGVIFVLQIVKNLVLSRVIRVSERSTTQWDNAVMDAIMVIGWPFYIAAGLYTGSKFITFDETVTTIINTAVLVITVIYLVLALQKFFEYALSNLIQRSSAGDEHIPLDNTIGNFLKNALRAALWVGAVLVILQNLGFEITALLGGLGIAGIAIAFAFQNILSDMFAFFSIYFDKPFKEGDFIVLGKGDMGTIQHIGLKTTRIKTLHGQELIVSNQELTSTRINNYDPMEKRRVEFVLRVAYETPLTKLRKIPGIIEAIVKKEADVEYGRTHFKEYGEYSLNYEIVYTVQSREYTVYMDIRQRINLAIKKAFEKEHISFAYPTHTVLYVKKS